MDLSTLKADVLSFLGRDVIPAAINLANSELSRRISILPMDRKTTLVVVSGVLTLPANCKKALSILNSDGVPLTVVSREKLAQVDPFGPICAYAITGSIVEIMSIPEDGLVFSATYCSKLADLAAASDTNDGLEYAYDAMLYLTLKHHALLNRDYDAAAQWSAQAEGAITSVNKHDMRARWSGSSLDTKQVRTVV